MIGRAAADIALSNGSCKYKRAENAHTVVINVSGSYEMGFRADAAREFNRGGCISRRAATDQAKPEISNGVTSACMWPPMPSRHANACSKPPASTDIDHARLERF
eukprot:gnl/MRDRNA2_/MRDRNA2_437491_c0_seq1.p1 gnl/MRDRNA2_/MRDRNA2_437491_c0~~gnl/MRDRNA2_/MRDRNA2_437491_c0_seq1.p1  ORF type:complete len:105 (+),score=4.58 gnl/MRDRNA2_/MRDRNA2_437491_c0_seq1:27-341(+)